MRKAAIVILAALSCGGRAQGAESPVPLVEHGQSRTVIVLGGEPSWQEEFAAAELAAYVAKMTSAKVAICRAGQADAPKSASRILLGRPRTHSTIAALAKQGLVSVDEKDLTSEGFLVKTVRWRDQPCLVIAGGGDTGTVYGVYDLLERFGRVGFFRYEEHVPKRGDFVIPACDIREKPCFRVRMHGGQFHYYGTHFYSEEQWKDDLRWYAKYRMNRHNYFPGPAVTNLAERGIWQRMGLADTEKQPGVSTEEKQAFEVLKRTMGYALKVGVRFPYWTTDGQLTSARIKEFKAKYPKVKYLELVRNDEHGTYIDPSDPMWQRVNHAYLEGLIEQFGDSKLYYLPSPWGERSPGNTPEEQERLTKDFAVAVGQLAQWAQKKYPGAEWALDGWALANKQYWQPYRVERFMNALPKDLNLVIWDYPAEDEPSYVYNAYWYGRPWAYIAFNTMGGNTAVVGDLYRLVGNVGRVLCDQRATQLAGFGYYTEARDYAPLYKDLVLHLAWNPVRDLDAFVRDYCERRYSPASVPAMIRCHEQMLKSVYGPQSNTHITDGFRTCMAMNPIYWYRWGEHCVPFDALQRRRLDYQRPWGPRLLDALKEAQSVREQEQDNPAYVRDVADLMRTYVQLRLHETAWTAMDAMAAGNLAEFEAAYAQTARLFDRLLAAVNLVSNRWEFGVNALVKDFEDAPIKRSAQEIRHYLHYTTFGGDKIHDYFRADRYEMIRDVYRPITMLYLDACREAMKKGDRRRPLKSKGEVQYGSIMDAVQVAQTSADPKYQAVIDRFVQNPCPPPPGAPAAARVVEDFLAAAKAGQI